MRINKDRYYLEIAKAVGLRSPCLRRKFGAIIVVNDAIVSTGYNGPARGVINCEEVGCLKDILGTASYTGYENCTAVHAEENAIINAARNGSSVYGGILYIALSSSGEGITGEARPCKRCQRAIINAGLEEVITMDSDGSIIRYDPEKWVEEDTKWYIERIKQAKESKK